jgi:hypothetical protein
MKTKPAMFLKWQDESTGQWISRDDAATVIRQNRRAPKELRIRVQRKYRETYISSTFLGVACCIYRT